MPTVSSNGIGVYYEIKGEGAPVLLVGGLGIDLTQLKGLVDGLAGMHKVIAFDNRGVGRTDKPDVPYSIDMMAQDASGLLVALGLGPVDVVGISLGGRIAMQLTLSRSDLVRSLVLASTSARTNYDRGVMWSLSNFLLRIPAVRKIGTEYPQPYYAYVRQRDASRGYDATERLKNIEKPTLIVHGRKDRVAPIELAEEMRSRIPGSKLVTIQGGHLSFFSKPFLEVVEAFLSEQSR